MVGLEIGPCHRPITPKKEGWNVLTLDHLDREGLIKKYKGHEGVDIQNIEDVDIIWHGEPLDKLIANNYFDFIIASHVIEHTPNLVSFINECGKLLKDDGILSLIIPDKRFCFDMLRPLSTTGRVLQAHAEKRSKHNPSNIFDEKAYSCNKLGEICWDTSDKRDFGMNHTLIEAIDTFNRSLTSESYIDAHAWCFTPTSFRLIIQDLNELNISNMKELHFSDTSYCEFFIQLSKSAPSSKMDRRETMKIIESELRQQTII